MNQHTKMSKNYYEILEVNKNSNVEDIKHAYKKMALKYHPDRNKDPSAEEKFKVKRLYFTNRLLLIIMVLGEFAYQLQLICLPLVRFPDLSAYLLF